ncbi:MAG: sulfite exporter TauE/SafE family protein [Dehalococcoidales bacterium]
MIDFSFWFMFPVATAIATIAMMAGIGGAIMFSPFFMLVLKLDPLLALGAGLVIEFFGFSSGMIGYWRKHEINFDIVKKIVFFTVPATVAGVFLGRVVPAYVLQIMLVLLLLYLAFQFLVRGKECQPKDPRCTGVSGIIGNWEVSWTTKLASLFGGLIVGMISAGLGEINELTFLKRMKLPVPTASATSVFLVAMSATAGSAIHAYFLITERNVSAFNQVASMLVFAVPGVIVGAQIGVLLANKINPRVMSMFVGILFSILAVFTLLLVI